MPVDMGENDENNDSMYRIFQCHLKDAKHLILKNNIFYRKSKRFNGNIAKISEFTGMERTALYRKFKSLNISFNKK